MTAEQIYEIVKKYNLQKYFSQKGGALKCTSTASMMTQQKK